VNTVCTYAPPNNRIAGTNQHAWEWNNYICYYYRLGIASRLSGNVTGGMLYHAGNNVRCYLRCARAFLSCGVPQQYKGWNPHNMEGANALFADGVVGRLKAGPDHPAMQRTGSSPERFRSYLNQTHPSYNPPQ